MNDESYDYDANGNREVANGDTYSTTANNRMQSDGTNAYLYDKEGNRVAKFIDSNNDQLWSSGESGTEYTWDHRNRLVKVTTKNSLGQVTQTVEYVYDALDQMVKRTLDKDGALEVTPIEQTFFLYEMAQIALQFDKTGPGDLAASDISHRYLWGAAVDQLLAQEDAAGNSLWALTDNLGTPRDWINSAGTLVDHAVYDTFGQRLNAEAVDAAFEWTARYRDPLTGLQYNNARWYNPAIQRWMSEDPIGFAASDANLNRYVGNSPTNFIDPTGFWLEWIVSPIRSYREWRRGLRLDNGLTDYHTNRAQEELALNPGSNASLKSLDCAYNVQANRAIGEATALAEFNYEFTAAGFSGGFVRPGASQTHHIATNKGKWANKFAELFDTAGINLNDARNSMQLPGHMGRHTECYHEFVFDRLKTAIGNKRGAAAEKALEKGLEQLRRDLEKNPRLPFRDGGLR